MHLAPGRLDPQAVIDFVVASADLGPHVLDTRVKREAELPTDHHSVVRWIRWRGRMLGSDGLLRTSGRGPYKEVR